MQTNSIIHVKDLCKRYREMIAVDQVSFDIDEGEIFSLLGPNGAGKTTTISMLTTVASIGGGEATVAGYDVRSESKMVRGKIGVVPQEVTLDDELKGIENLLFASSLHHVQERVARERAKRLLELVELEDSAEKRVRTFSGGMKRRLQLISAMIHEPQVLFLDEPTVGLDVQTRTKIWDYVKQLNEEQGVSIFFTTHYLEEADYLSDKIAIMDQGRIKLEGSPSELKDGLRGDVLTLRVADDVADLTTYLSSIESVNGVSKSGDAYRLKLSKVETALPEIITGISSRGIKIRETTFSKPSLDQVFLEVTGRSLRDVEEGRDGHDIWQKQERR